MHKKKVHLLSIVLYMSMVTSGLALSTNSPQPEQNTVSTTAEEWDASSHGMVNATSGSGLRSTENSTPLSNDNITENYNNYDYDMSELEPESKFTTKQDQTSSVPSLPSSTKAAADPLHPVVYTALPTINKSAGVFIFIIILILIAALVVILYIFWKKGRRYSFDLTNNDHDTPLRSMDYGGIFSEQIKEPTSLDFVQEEKPNETKPVSNGCSTDSPELTPYSEQNNVPEENSFSSDSSLPVKRVEFNLDIDLICEPESKTQDRPEPSEPDQNENNNNDTVTDSVDLFTEINLDEPQ